ncbi:ISNCY family transposase [Candidatus Parcubacteria bacterium]|nr:ISNCY family transposase [Candidatus Parcubacteria bacterium]
MDQKLISMSKKELSRYEIINDLIGGKINGTDASKQIGVSVRHIKRLKSKVGEYGAEGLKHKSRGRAGNRKLDAEIVKKAEKYLKEKYPNFKPTFASEKLYENHNIKLGREKVRLIMAEMGLWKPKPRKQPKKRHVWRARKDNYGEMQQFDGSYHIWFGNEESCLLLSVDDATGKITHAKFDYNEGVIAVFKFWLEYFEKNGLPLSIYLDKFSTYKINHKNAVDNKDLITQFERAMNQVGGNLITAHSPEAKGRVERMNGTLQDRLVKELKLAGITTIEDANGFLKEYIPKFNAKFAVAPNRRADLHKKLSETAKEKLPQIFSIQDQRKVMNDYTIMFENKFFQLNEKQPTTVYKKDTVIIEKHLNGDVKINLKEHYLDYTELPERPKKIINIKLAALTIRKQSNWKPPADHPWRRQFLLNRQKNMATERVLTRAMESR